MGSGQNQTATRSMACQETWRSSSVLATKIARKPLPLADPFQRELVWAPRKVWFPWTHYRNFECKALPTRQNMEVGQGASFPSLRALARTNGTGLPSTTCETTISTLTTGLAIRSARRKAHFAKTISPGPLTARFRFPALTLVKTRPSSFSPTDDFD